MQTVSVHVGGGYQVYIGEGLLNKSAELLSPCCAGKRLLVVTDDNVAPLYLDRLCRALGGICGDIACHTIPNGEDSKSFYEYERLLRTMAEQRMDRGDLLLALGGGVVGDLTGFAAACYRRGISYIQIPTSLLAAVDSSVGGKTGINLPEGKNQVGAFHQPAAVLCDTDCLDTLPLEELRCGMAEVIKYAVIGDEGLFRLLSDGGTEAGREEIIARCVSMKRDLVEKDQFDRGERMLLNFGHTPAHAIELLSDYKIPHGQAVAMGMVCMCRAGERLGFTEIGTAAEVEGLLKKYSLPTELPYAPDALADAACADKKLRGGRMSIIVPKKTGLCLVTDISSAELPLWFRAGGKNEYAD